MTLRKGGAIIISRRDTEIDLLIPTSIKMPGTALCTELRGGAPGDIGA